jgi:ADP-ribosylglycohydrolase
LAKPNPLPHDYETRVYAGVLGKIIGVYLGRPIENWIYERITETYGEVDRYLPSTLRPLVTTDDDITGTFTFLRALADSGYPAEITPQQISEAWLNYTIEGRTIFWWGGLGNSTEHTAYLRMKDGIPAPESGSCARNGKVISEQIGAQIFIDGWAMVSPGDPERAADLAQRAASVSHDGEAIYGAQVIAAMEALAFVEPNLNMLLDSASSLIPSDSVIARVIHDVRNWHAGEPDWRKTRDHIAATYGYDKYIGPCHIVPNHALIHLALLYGSDDFSRSLMIVNTSGWDTDCNSGNVGCLLGIKNGLDALEGGYDWRGPVADRLYLPTADGGRAITDAVTEARHVIEAGRALAGLERIPPKSGARFHFEFPGSVQGFQVEDGRAKLTNVLGHSLEGNRSLRIELEESTSPVYARTATFIPPEALDIQGYELIASPTLYSGQLVRARLEADARNPAVVVVSPRFDVFDANDALERHTGPSLSLEPGADPLIEWRIPATRGQPIAYIGLEFSGAAGTVYLDFLTWSGEPELVLDRPAGNGSIWRRSWANGVDQFENRWSEPYRIVKNHGTGLISQGTADWMNYRASAPITIQLATSAGIAARVQGLRRYYALLLCDDQTARLVKVRSATSVLAETPFVWQPFTQYELAIDVDGDQIRAAIDGVPLFAVRDDDPLPGGGVGLVVEAGCLSSEAVHVTPNVAPYGDRIDSIVRSHS